MPVRLAGAEEEPVGLVLATPLPRVADMPSATVSKPVAVAADLLVTEAAPLTAADILSAVATAPAAEPSVFAEPVPAVADAPPLETPLPAPAAEQPPPIEEQAMTPIEEPTTPQPPAQPDLQPAERLSVGDLAEWEQNVDMLQDKLDEEAEEEEERYLEEAVSDDVKEVFGTGIEDDDDDDEDEDEEKSELDAMLDLFTTELVEETDANRLAALLGEVDARDLLSEAQEILNELRSPARGRH